MHSQSSLISMIRQVAQEVNARVGNGAGEISTERANQIYVRLPLKLQEEIAFWGPTDLSTKKMVRNHLLEAVV